MKMVGYALGVVTFATIGGALSWAAALSMNTR